MNRENIIESPFFTLSSTLLKPSKGENLDNWILLNGNEKLKIWVTTTDFPIERERSEILPANMHLYRDDVEIPFEKVTSLPKLIEIPENRKYCTWGWELVGGSKVLEAENLALSGDCVARHDFGGVLYTSNGTISGDIWLDSGSFILKIIARGRLAKGIGPIMVIKLDNRIVGKQEVRATSWTSYSFELKTNLGLRHFEVAFINDYYDKEKGEDRNLRIDKIFFEQGKKEKGLVYLIDRRGQNNITLDSLYKIDYIRKLDRGTPQSELYYFQNKYVNCDLSVKENPYNLKKKIEIDGEVRKVIFAPSESKFEFNLSIPKRAILNFGFGIMKWAWNKQGDGAFFALYLKDRFKKHKLFSKYINPKKLKEHRKWFDECIDLSPYEGKNVKIILETKGKGDNDYDFAVWSNPILITQERKMTSNIILISIDTLRADHLSSYGYKRCTSPEIDKLAQDGILFESAIVQSPWTLPSHISLMTSLYPAEHGVLEKNHKLADSVITLAEILRGESYISSAYTGGGFVSSIYGFDQGFDQYYNYKLAGASPYEVFEITVKTLNWLNKNKDKRFFLFVHTYQTHDPYLPPEPYDRLYSNDYKGKITGHIANAKEQKIAASCEADREQLIALYDGEIKYTDKYMGILFNKLKELNLYNDTLIIFTSDHGEEFYEHKGWLHSKTLYDEAIRVPLIIKLPRQYHSGLRINSVVSCIDIMPTILDVVGISIPDFCRGASLIPLLNRKLAQKISNSVAFSGPTRYTDNKFSIRTNEYKYITNKSRSFEKLFNLKNDPIEQNDLSATEILLKKKFRRRVDDFILLKEEFKKYKFKIDEETREKLKSLGYLK